MPVRKFRSIDEMTPPGEPRAGDARNLEIALGWSRASLLLDGRRLPAGVRKFRSIEDANTARMAWERTPR